MDSKQKRLAQLPQVDRLMQHTFLVELGKQYPREIIIDVIRQELAACRNQLLNDTSYEFKSEPFLQKIKNGVQELFKPSLRRAINAAGIILHTNMGRAPLSPVAQQALQDVAENYCNLELDMASGKRGNRYQHVEALICHLTGAEGALVVNNNAAATFLILNTLSFGKESIISRGELITIGDSFRLPEIMRHSGTQMIEVGTTNQTLISDYTEKINAETALLVKVHTSNYKITGFTAEASLEELVTLGQKFKIPVLHDVGSGALIDLSQYGLPKEPVIRESIELGADVVCFSGDKLIGGPQSGIIVGKKEFIQKLKKNQLTRALRAGKLTYAALEATLRLFLDEKALLQKHAVMHLLTRPLASLKQQGEEIIQALIACPIDIELQDGLSEVGGGSLATESLPTKMLTLNLATLSADQLSQKLRENQPPIISRIQNNRVCLDLRTIREDEGKFIIDALKKITNAE
jgi:L-seryl-tRNA(Ser) seleniumtransferase